MRKARLERGQILPVAAFALVALLGIGAFSIDVGYAYYAKRQLQSATDAAALAGAQDLPTTATAYTTAASYAAANMPANLGTSNFTYKATCTNASIIASGCVATVNANSLTVTGSASTNTWFAGIFGIDHFNVSAHANACSPCSATPVDVVIAIDRTGSMCLDENNRHDCGDLNNAKNGVRAMLKILNPPYAQIGMVAFPPLTAPVAPAVTDLCASPQGLSGNYTAYDDPDNVYLNDKIGSDYKALGAINEASSLAKHMKTGDGTCVVANGYTSYSEALRQAKKELDADGRPKVPDVIVFLTDGEANIGSVYGVDSTLFPPNGPDDKNPCQSAINVADGIKKAGVTIYSIGYALGASTNCTRGDWPIVHRALVPEVKAVAEVIAVPYKPAVWNSSHTKIITAAVPAVVGVPAVPYSAAVPAHDEPCDPTIDDNCDHEAGVGFRYHERDESPARFSDDTVEAIATKPTLVNQKYFYPTPSDGDLSKAFAAIATDIGSGSSRLVDDGY